MEITESRTLNDRKHFLIRALNKGHVTKDAYDKEMVQIEAKLSENLRNRLAQCAEQIKKEMQEAKQTITTDGDLKRNIARKLIEFLKTDFNSDEIKGIMRQGYKIMRGQQ